MANLQNDPPLFNIQREGKTIQVIIAKSVQRIDACTILVNGAVIEFEDAISIVEISKQEVIEK